MGAPGGPAEPSSAAVVSSADAGAIIVAAGAGRRFGGRKALIPVAGRPLVLHSLGACEASPSVGWIVVVAHPDDCGAIRSLAAAAGIGKLSGVVAGGPSRAASVALGLEALPEPAQLAMIHDAARPCAHPGLMEAVLAQARAAGGAACGVPASVTVKSADAQGLVRLTLDRRSLWLVQTPQAFRRAWLAEAIARVRAGARGPEDPLEAFPDDAALVEWAGRPVRMVPAEAWNVKITEPDDVVVAEAVLRHRARQAQAAASAKAGGLRRPRPAW